MNLTPHFTLEELTHSDTAVRLGIDNTPNAEQIDKLHELAIRLEMVRTITGGLIVTSGFRCLALNRAIGSSDHSQHVKCEAADVKSAIGLTPLQLCQKVAEAILPYDQLIYEFGTWMHISFAPGREPRRQVLTIDKRGTLAGLQPREAVA